MSSPSPPRETSLPPGWRPGWPVFAANPDARLVLVDGDATDFTEANLDVALRLAEGPGDLQGVAIGPAEQVVVGEGEWIAWPGDPQPAGEEAEASIHVGDAGQAIGAAAAGLGRARAAAAGAGLARTGPHPRFRHARAKPSRLLAGGAHAAMAAEEGEGAGRPPHGLINSWRGAAVRSASIASI
jgi:hypothetical protein